MTDFARELAELWAAGTSILYVVTHEEARAVEICASIAAGVDRGFAVWSSHRGLDPTAREAKSALEALDVLGTAIAPAMAVLLDFQDALVDPIVVRRLRDLVPAFTAEQRCVVIIAPELKLPDGLAADTAVLRLPLPDEAELTHLVDSLILGANAAAPLAQRDAAVRAARGLTSTQARRAFVRALLVDPALRAERDRPGPA